MAWFNVPGQFCPIALGNVSCETNYDCSQKLQTMSLQNSSCSQLTGPTTGLGWTDAGAVWNSSAGNVKCDPFRKVCTVENFEVTKNKDFWAYTSIVLAVAIISILLILFFTHKCDVNEIVNCIASEYKISKLR